MGRLWGNQGTTFSSIVGGEDWAGGVGADRPSTSGGMGGRAGVGGLRKKTPRRAYRADEPPPPNPFLAQRPPILAASRYHSDAQAGQAPGGDPAGQTPWMSYGWGERRTQLRTAPPRFSQGRPGSTLPSRGAGLGGTAGSQLRPNIPLRRAVGEQDISANRGAAAHLGSRERGGVRSPPSRTSSRGGLAPEEKQMWDDITVDVVDDGSMSGSEDEDWELSTMSLADYMEQLVAPQEISRGSRLNSRGSYLANEDCRPPSGPLDVLPQQDEDVPLGGNPRDLVGERSLEADSADSVGDPGSVTTPPGIAWRESEAEGSAVLSEHNLALLDRGAAAGSYRSGGGAMRTNGRVPSRGRVAVVPAAEQDGAHPWERESEERMDAAVKQPTVRGGGVRELDSPRASPRLNTGGEREKNQQQQPRHMRQKPHSARAVMEGFHRHLHARSAWADMPRPPSRQRPPPEALWLEGTTAPRMRTRTGKGDKLSLAVDSEGQQHLGEVTSLDQQARPWSGPARVSRQRGESDGPPSPTKAALLDRDILTSMLRRPPSRQRPPPDAQGLDDRKPLLLSSDID